MRFCGECGSALDVAPGSRHDGELRLLSIVFCDLVGSTQWSTQLDPEDLRNMMRRYHRACSEAVNALGGRVIQFVGDGVLATFGAPPVLEDSTRRAVEAALEMVSVTAHLDAPDGRPLAARAAVHTGFVVLSQMGGGGAVRLDLIGEAANAAARLQGYAPIGGVLVSDAVAQAVAGRFELRPVGDLELRGIDIPMAAYEVLGRTTAVDALSARAVAGLSPFIGREIERDLLLRRCLDADLGQPQIAVVVGEAGIGKSRLVREVRHAPQLENARTLVLRGEQDRASTPFGPFVTLVNSPAVDAPSVPEGLVELLGAPTAPESADRRRARTIEALHRWITGLAQSDLLLLLVEDLHWVDPSTIEVITSLHLQSSDARLAVLATARPPWSSPWSEIDGLTVLPLDRLDDGAISALLDALGVADLAPIRQLVGRAEGVPLYLEEIAALATRETSLAAGQVPITIAELMSSRLETTGDGALASDCSVLGRDIDLDVAARVLAIDVAELQRRLEHFVRCGIMRNRHGGRGYSFRHGLLRDAAYSMLLRSDRHRLHAAAARVLAELDEDARSEEVAHHLEAAGDLELAWRAWERAAAYAAGRNAFVEAGAFYASALETLQALPDTPERVVNELLVAMAATTVSYRVNGGGAPETVALSALSERLASAAIAGRELDRNVRLGLLITMHAYYFSRPDYARAADLAGELEALRESGGTGAVFATWIAGMFALMTGDNDAAERGFLACLEAYEPRRRQLGQPDVGVVSAAYLAHVAVARGDDRAADDWLRSAFDYLALHDEPFHRAWLTLCAAKVHARRGDRGPTAALAGEAHDLSVTYGFEQVEPQARALVAWASSGEPDDEVFEALRAAVRDMEASGSRADCSLELLLLARSLLEAGRIEEARSAHRGLVDYCETTSEWVYRREIAELGRSLTDAGSPARGRDDLA